MSQVLGEGVIRVSADSTQLKAGIEDAKRSVRSLGNSIGESVQAGSTRAQRSIEAYIKRVEFSASAVGKSARETKLLELAERGASQAQIRRADAALRTVEAFKQQQAAARATAVATRSVEGSLSSLTRSFSSLNAVIGGVSVALLARQLAAASDAYASMNARLRLVTSSTLEFQQAQSAVFDIAQQTRTGLEATSTLFGKLAQSTESLGVTQAEVLDVTRSINQALIVSGGSASSAAAALVQLGQGFASGVLRGEELNSVLEQAPRLARAIANGLGVPIGRLRELGEAGELTADKVFRALQASAGQLDREFGQIPLTIGQATQQASNALLRLIGVIDDTSDASRGLAGVISDVAGFISQLADEIDLASQGADNVGLIAEAFVTISETLRVLASDVSFVFKGIGREIGAVAAQIKALATLDIAGFRAISDAVTEDARRARQELDNYQRYVLTRVRNDPTNESVVENRRLGIGQPQRVVRPNDPPRPARTGSSARDPFGDAVKGLREQIALTGKLTELEKVSEQISLGKYGKLKAAQAEQLKGLAAELDLRKDLQAEQDAKLGIDLAGLKRDLDRLTATYAAADAILEAQREANLVDDKSYFDQKLAFIKRGADAEVKELQDANARLAQEKKTGAERIRIQEQIAENEARIALIQINAGAQAEVLGIKQKRAAELIAIGYQEAEAAAQSYLDTLRRSQAIELGGLGLGNAERQRLSGRAQIEERYEEQRQRLASDRRNGDISEQQYAEELARINRFQSAALTSYDEYYSALLEKQKDWQVGASEALANYLSDAGNIAAQTEALFTDAFRGMEDALVQFVQTGKIDFKSLADSIVADIIRISIRQSILGPIAEMLKGLGTGAPSAGSSSSGFASFISSIGSFFSGGRAIGGPVSAGGVYRVNEKGPGELLSVAGKQYLLMGNQGGEVKPAGASRNTTVNVNLYQTFDQNTSKQTVGQAAILASQAINRELARGTV